MLAIAILFALAIGLLALAEVAIRVSGISNFPLFAKDAQGYRMKARQSGRFRRRHRWRYDAWGMRDDRDLSSLSGHVVIIGDSVVDGGSQIDQDETLLARLRGLIDQPVYAVSCHGWSLGNELAVLQSLPDWNKASRLIFVLNTGDFDTIETAPTQFSFPTRYPMLFLPWLIGRRLYRDPRFGRFMGWREPLRFNPEVREQVLGAFNAMLERYQGDVLLVRYPQRNEDPAREPYFTALAEACVPRHGGRLIDVVADPRWAPDCYLDTIHPNSHGVRVLADVIAKGAF